MSHKVFLVTNGNAVYAVPVDVCEEYALEGKTLTAAQAFLDEEVDVLGQDVVSADPYVPVLESGGSSKGRARVADLNAILDKATKGQGNSR